MPIIEGAINTSNPVRYAQTFYLLFPHGGEGVNMRLLRNNLFLLLRTLSEIDFICETTTPLLIIATSTSNTDIHEGGGDHFYHRGGNKRVWEMFQIHSNLFQMIFAMPLHWLRDEILLDFIIVLVIFLSGSIDLSKIFNIF